MILSVYDILCGKQYYLVFSFFAFLILSSIFCLLVFYFFSPLVSVFWASSVLNQPCEIYLRPIFFFQFKMDKYKFYERGEIQWCLNCWRSWQFVGPWRIQGESKFTVPMATRQNLALFWMSLFGEKGTLMQFLGAVCKWFTWCCFGAVLENRTSKTDLILWVQFLVLSYAKGGFIGAFLGARGCVLQNIYSQKASTSVW